MREILFRGFSSGEVFYGHLFTEILPSCALYAAIVKEIDGHYRNVVVDEKTVGQFTGLTDCNGVKIFEGDIVSGFNGELVGAVEWSDEDCLFWISTGNGGGQLTYSYAVNWKVIGNIHQNPELLERTNANHN